MSPLFPLLSRASFAPTMRVSVSPSNHGDYAASWICHKTRRIRQTRTLHFYASISSAYPLSSFYVVAVAYAASINYANNTYPHTRLDSANNIARLSVSNPPAASTSVGGLSSSTHLLAASSSLRSIAIQLGIFVRFKVAHPSKHVLCSHRPQTRCTHTRQV